MSTIKSSSEHLTLNADGASKDIKFQANGVEKASIDSSGNLTVSGNLTSVGIDDNADATAITINSDESVSFANAVVITDTINAGSSGSSGGTTGKINFGGVSGSIDGFTITNENGNYLNIKPNSSSNGIKILNSGGMCFGTDTATANALDDYEEGTWTPTFDNVTAPTYSHNDGHYRKIGTIVYCTVDILVASGLDTSDGSAVNIMGLPYTRDGSCQEGALATLGRYSPLLNGRELHNVRMTSGSGVILQKGNNSHIAYNECASSGQLQIHFQYISNS